MRKYAGLQHSFAKALLAGALACVASLAQAGDGDTFSVFSASDLNRQVHGGKRAVDLSAGPLRLGDASAFFGVDSLSDNMNHYLTSGLQWESGKSNNAPLMSVGAMHTVSRGADFASQTLVRAETQLDLGGRWYLPDLTLQTDQLSSSGGQGVGLNGRATHFGFGNDFDKGGYHVAYFRADRDYTPWGGALTAGDRGVELSGRYNLSSRWRLSNTLQLHDGDIKTGTSHAVVDKWQLSGVKAPTDIGQPWRLTAQLGDVGLGGRVDRTPLAVQFASQTRRWRDWHIDSALGWYQGQVTTPDAMPIDGGLWEVSASHYLDLGGLRTRLSPSFSIGGSRYGQQALGSRTGVAMGFPGLLDNVALSVDYLSAGWGPTEGRADMQLSLNVSQNAGAILPRLNSLVDRLRGGWFGQ